MTEPEAVTGDVSDDLGQEYYKKEDLVDEPILLTIKGVARRLFPAKDKNPEAKKLELTFTEPGSKKLVLNKTNLKILPGQRYCRPSCYRHGRAGRADAPTRDRTPREA